MFSELSFAMERAAWRMRASSTVAMEVSEEPPMGLFDLFKKKAGDAELGDAARKYAGENYVPRDGFKTKAYYLGEINRANKMKRSSAERYLWIGFYNLYLVGATKDDMRECAQAYCDQLGAKDARLTYNQAIRALALTVLFDIDRERIAFIGERMPEEKHVDATLDLLRNYVFEGTAKTDKDFYFSPNLSGNFTKKTDGFMDVVHAQPGEPRTEAFVKFLNTVMKRYGNRKMKDYERQAERLGEDNYNYEGLFDYCYTAVAKAYDISKDALEGSPFIAIDLI